MVRLPQVNGERMVGVAAKLGWYIDRQRGSHAVMRHAERPGEILTIPRHRRPMKPAVLHSVMKTLGISAAELRRIL